jgi:YD repeat-containing protein
MTDVLNHTTTYAYDTRNRLTATTDATNHTISYAYDSASHQTSVTDQRSNVTSYTYDAMGRMLTKVLPDANPNNHPTDTYVRPSRGRPVQGSSGGNDIPRRTVSPRALGRLRCCRPGQTDLRRI